MSLSHNIGLALVGLAATLGMSTSAHAFANIAVTPTVTSVPGTFTYSYDVTPDFDAKQLAFTFSDTNVTFESVTGPLSTVTPTSAGSFVNYSLSGGTLTSGSTETIVFTSPDGPFGTLGVSGTGFSGKTATAGYADTVVGPAAVPEASTTASFGLLLALGLGGVMVAARKKSVKAS